MKAPTTEQEALELTGATRDQVEQAAERANASWGYGEGMPSILRPQVFLAARFLVPPTHRIVSADDLERLVNGSVNRELYDRLRELVK